MLLNLSYITFIDLPLSSSLSADVQCGLSKGTLSENKALIILSRTRVQAAQTSSHSLSVSPRP